MRFKFLSTFFFTYVYIKSCLFVKHSDSFLSGRYGRLFRKRRFFRKVYITLT